MGGVIKTVKGAVSDVTGSLFGRNAGAQATGDPVIDEALLSPDQISQSINRILNLTGRGPIRVSGPGNLSLGPEQSPFFADFTSAIQNPFIPTGPEQQLLDTIQANTSAQFARRGLGGSPIAASNVAASIAPALVQLRQNRINELGSAINQSLEGQGLRLGQRAQNINLRGQDINSLVTQRANTIGDLLNLLTFGRRSNVGQITRGAQPGIFPQVFPRGSQDIVQLGGAIKGGF